MNFNFKLTDIPIFEFEHFREEIYRSITLGQRVSSFFAAPEADNNIKLYCVLSDDHEGCVHVMSALVQREFPSLTRDFPQLHLFEREIYEEWKVKPLGHPWLKPVRFHPPYVGDGQCRDAIGVTNYFSIAGDEVHEVGVGPVHAGVIEPGHFRFNCHGETVHHLEISLGYQHRGIEKTLWSGPHLKTLYQMETLAGDTTIGHAWAYCQNIESLGQLKINLRDLLLRITMLELERLANHTGDLGALSGDIGYLPTLSFCGRLRGDFLNLSAFICGSRFGRGMMRPGAVAFDLSGEKITEFLKRLELAYRDTKGAVDLLWQSASVLARFEDTGVVTRSQAIDLGLVGPVARGSGLERDIRKNYDQKEIDIYRLLNCTLGETGDVFARAQVRYLEITESVKLIRECMKELQLLDEKVSQRKLREEPCLAPDRLSVSLVEGWRGEICHTAITDKEGKFKSYKVVDPSFHNWQGLSLALRGEEISDFPLCNKSFNLSYCGYDL